MTLLFLDIDGVFNTSMYILDHKLESVPPNAVDAGISPIDWNQINPDIVHGVNQILKQFPSTEVILTSDWRKYKSIGYINDLFHHKGAIWSFHNKTPTLDGDRAAEISALMGSRHVQDIVIVDDNIWDGFQGIGNFVHVDSKYGLTPVDINRIIKIFEGFDYDTQ